MGLSDVHVFLGKNAWFSKVCTPEFLLLSHVLAFIGGKLCTLYFLSQTDFKEKSHKPYSSVQTYSFGINSRVLCIISRDKSTSEMPFTNNSVFITLVTLSQILN